MAILYKTFLLSRTVFYAIMVCFFWVLPSYAGDPLYTVEGIEVDVTAASALAARDQAFEKAQQDAFTALAARMIPEESIATFTPPPIDTIANMVQDYEVTKEKLSSVRYIGTYTFTFRPRSVQQFFNTQNVQFTDTVSKPVLVLPFYKQGEQTTLWSPYNIWMKAWNRSAQTAPPVPLTLPIGDLSDVSDIGDDEVYSYDPSKLESLLSRYETGEAAIVVATPDGSLQQAGEDDPADGKSVTISLYRTDRGQPEHVQEMVVSGRMGDTLGTLLDNAVAQVKTALRSNWKEKTIAGASADPSTSTASGGNITARVKIGSLEEWASVQRSLAKVGGVTAANLKSLTPREAIVELVYRGNEDILRRSLEQSGMLLLPPTGVIEGAAGIYDLSIPQQPAPPSNYPTGNYHGLTPQAGYSQETTPGQYPQAQDNGYQRPQYAPQFEPQDSGYHGSF